MERIISDQAIKLEDLEFTLKQALESEQTIVRSSKETLHHMEVCSYMCLCCILFQWECHSGSRLIMHSLLHSYNILAFQIGCDTWAMLHLTVLCAL